AAQESAASLDEPDMAKLPEGLRALGVSQARATGGAARESLAEAQTRARAGLKTRFQAVTSDDYEYLARATPGLRVARAKAVPLYRPGLADYPAQQLPAEGGGAGEGWPFGRTVFKSEVYQAMEGVEGVDCVERVALTASGVGVGRDAQGNVTIQPQSLVYPGEHRIEVMFVEARCRRMQ